MADSDECNDVWRAIFPRQFKCGIIRDSVLECQMTATAEMTLGQVWKRALEPGCGETMLSLTGITFRMISSPHQVPPDRDSRNMEDIWG